ncbi:hypothetical protein ELQ21_10765 [Neisseria meningitidis]|nr:hypothetical protein [Neisseria meningitidis]MBG8648040.1 hypothetical protein [Neisseria meningitidis]MBG8668186.1 hypothetical protein [Neisseria meningitidis]MBG8689728.1 hypothetical protein [Neisseria meningitidis]MBG8737837.1 hypothetical protein [Neisseria meningitidis]
MFAKVSVFPTLRLRIPVFAGIRFFEFQSFLINSCSFGFLDSRLRGNDEISVFDFLFLWE